VNALLYYLIDPQISFRGIAIKSLKANWRFSSSHKYLGQNKQRLVVDVVVLQSGKKIVLYDQSGWHNACCFCYVSTNECFLLDIILTEDILEDMLDK
jgi:hypothetical protein